MILKTPFFLFAILCVLTGNAQSDKQFIPGEIRNDNNGKHISAHGCGIKRKQ